MSRDLPAARELLARIVKAASAPIHSDTGDEEEAGVRQAFLDAKGIEPADPHARIGAGTPDTAPIPARLDPSEEETVGSRASEMTVRPSQWIAPGSGSEDEASAPAPSARTGWPGAAPVAASAPPASSSPATVTTRPDEPEAIPAVTAPADPRETAPGHLLRVPGSTRGAADDFFDGLIRRVEDR